MHTIRLLLTIAIVMLTTNSLVAAPFLYSANSNSTVSVIDTASNEVTATIALAADSNPTKICLNPLIATAYTLNSGANTISVINTNTNTESTTITDVRFTELLTLACSPDGTRVYVTNYDAAAVTDKNHLYIIDASNNTVLPDAVSVGANPAEMTLNKDGSKAYVLNLAESTLSIIDTTTKDVSTIVFNMEDSQLGLAMHTNDAYLYILNTDNALAGTLEFRDPVTGGTIKSSANTGMVPYNIKVNHTNNLIYIGDFDGLKSVDPETQQVTSLVSTLEDYFLSLELNYDASQLYVAIQGNDSLSAYSTLDFTAPPATIALDAGSAPQSLAALPGPRHLLTTTASGDSTGAIVTWPFNLTYPDANSKSTLVPENLSISIRAEAVQDSIINWTGCDSVTGNGTAAAICTVNPLTEDKTVNASFSSRAVMSSPANGSTLSGASQTFTWNNVGAISYGLDVGTSVGASNISTYRGTSTSRTVTTLPVDGRTLYVRLYSQLASGWVYNDYTYTAAFKAALTSPANGSTLTGTSQTFTWANTGATAYQLYVGTTGPGSANIGYFPTAPTAATSTTVSRLPANGGTVYVRLYSQVAGVWYFSDYTFTAFSAMVSPVNGSSLTGASQLFTWTNTGATAYQLYVGTTGPGSANIGYFPTAPTAATSTTVSRLPLNGSTVYVRLYAQKAGIWSFTDHTYSAFNSIVSPVNGSTLTGTSQTFTWANTGATAYQLYVGTTGPGSTNIGYFPTAPTAATSTTVSRLPSNGGTVYVRLYSQKAGVWSCTDYTYTAFSAMVSPVNGSSLTGASQTFTWANTGAAAYQLYVGTTGPGSTNIGFFPTAPTAATSTTVNRLPLNGSTVYVRLYAQKAGIWSFTDHTYSAFNSIVSPVNGSTLTGASQLFTWADTGATAYQLYVGTTGPGSTNIGYFPTAPTAATSTTVSRLPLNGSTVYVRLYSQKAGVWSCTDYTYKAFNSIVSPLNNSTLTGASQLFTWADTGSTAYQLYVGTTGPGSTNIGYFPTAPTAATSTTVSRLPLNGSTVYVRLYSQKAGVWSSTDYTYTAFNSILSPLNNSTLTGASQTFTWANTGATAYQLYVGTTGPGSANIGYFPAAPTAATSTTVSGLPTNGSPVYVRLYSQTGGIWSFIDYTYSAFGP